MNQQDITQTFIDEHLKDRRAQRRASYIKLAVIGALALGYLAAGLYATRRDVFEGDKDYVALVRVTGEIGAGKEASAQALDPLLEKAFSDKKAKGVILLVNSPGGTPVQSSLIHDHILALKKEHHKKVIAVGEDMMTSGAYFIAVAADEIVVNRSTLAGSIGVISRSFGFTGLMDKLGVERRVMTAGESKNMLDPFGPQTEQDRLKQGELLKAIHQHFKDTVIEGRGKRLKLDSPGLFSGTVWTGDVAVTMGLADKLGDVKSASKEAFGTDKVREYAPPKSLMDIAMSSLGLTVAKELVPRLEGPMALPQ